MKSLMLICQEKQIINTNDGGMTVAPSDSDRFQLPARSTCGKPPHIYSYDMFKTVKYQIENYMSTHRFPFAGKAFVSQM